MQMPKTAFEKVLQKAESIVKVQKEQHWLQEHFLLIPDRLVQSMMLN